MRLNAPCGNQFYHVALSLYREPKTVVGKERAENYQSATCDIIGGFNSLLTGEITSDISDRLHPNDTSETDTTQIEFHVKEAQRERKQYTGPRVKLRASSEIWRCPENLTCSSREIGH